MSRPKFTDPLALRLSESTATKLRSIDWVEVYDRIDTGDYTSAEGWHLELMSICNLLLVYCRLSNDITINEEFLHSMRGAVATLSDSEGRATLTGCTIKMLLVTAKEFYNTVLGVNVKTKERFSTLFI